MTNLQDDKFGRAAGALKYGDLIQFDPIESVVQLRMVSLLRVAEIWDNRCSWLNVLMRWMMVDCVEVGSFCPNSQCPGYGKTEPNSVIKFGRSRQGRQRFRCTCCGQTFNENRGTLFYRKRVPEKEILEALALLAEGSRISRVARVKGFKKLFLKQFLRAVPLPI